MAEIVRPDKKTHDLTLLPKELHSDYKSTESLRTKSWNKIYQTNYKHKKTGMAVLMLKKSFKKMSITKEEDGEFKW